MDRSGSQSGWCARHAAVSNPFRAGHWIVDPGLRPAARTQRRFKPLQSGALDRRCVIRLVQGTIRPQVSNPFRAGHWIVGLWAAFIVHDWGCFKPLQSGALDRRDYGEGARAFHAHVSNPFRAGHWIVVGVRTTVTGTRWFQTPSERGIGS